MNETILTAFANLLVMHDCRKFHKMIMKRCTELKINESFREFLFRKEDGEYVGDAYQCLFVAPIMYLANSKAFNEYYNTLDSDFKYDVIDPNDLFNADLLLKHNKELIQELHVLMGSDAKYVCKN